MYLQQIVQKDVVYGIIQAIEKEAKISISVMKPEKGFPPDFVLLSLVITIRQVIRSNLKTFEQRLNQELVEASLNANHWDKAT